MVRRRWEPSAPALSVGFVLASLVAAVAAGQPMPQSGEFQVNTYTPFNQAAPVVATDDGGGFVVVWEQHDVGGPVEVVGRRFASGGAGLGPDFQINVFTTGRQRSPWVGQSAAGGFVVVWASQQDGDGYGVFARRFDAAGAALATELQVNTYTPGSQSFPRVGVGSGGDFVVVWQSDGQDGDDWGVFGRRFDSAGTALAAEFAVNLHTVDIQQGAGVFPKGDGSFVVTWASGLQDGSGLGAFGRRFDSGGAPGDEFQINAYTAGDQGAATLVHAPAGGFVAVWHSQQDGDGFGIFGRGFEDDGQPEEGGELQVNSFTTADQTLPTVLYTGGGRFVLLWTSDQQDGDQRGIFLQAIGDEGVPIGDELAVNTTTFGSQLLARAAATGARFVVVWQSLLQDGSGFGVFGRRFVLPPVFDIDGDGLVLPLTDGLLFLRYSFGFRGAVLVTGVVGSGCTRCTAPAIEEYLASFQ